MTVSTLKWLDRSTNTPARRTLFQAVQGALAGFARTRAMIFTPVPGLQATADELFEKADAYEATQPGYAADLRTAARVVQARHFGTW